MKEEGTDKTALGRYCLGKIKRLRNDKEGVYGIKAKNREQTFALDMLMDPNIKLMTLMGLPGGGKSVIALASGLEQVLRGGLYSQFLIARPIVPMGGKDAIGFIPGDLDQKLRPWMQPIYDNLEFILMGAGKKNGAKNYEELIEEGIIKIEALSYVRGRTFANKFVLIDDAQNLSLLEMKTIITRCGDDTKVIITGDLDQIDNPYLDKSTCGLAIVIDKMKDNPMVGHITLTKGERSELATYAANAL